MPKAAEGESQRLGYNVVRAQTSHAEMQMLQFGYKYGVQMDYFDPVPVSIGISRRICENCQV